MTSNAMAFCEQTQNTKLLPVSYLNWMEKLFSTDRQTDRHRQGVLRHFVPMTRTSAAGN